MPKQKLPYKGHCSECPEGTESWIVRRSPVLCQLHNHKFKQAKKREKKKKAEPIGEAEVFKKIWETRKRVSFVTGDPLPDQSDARSFYFSHMLPKGKAKYPMFKYYRKNIQFKTYNEHQLWENYQFDLKSNPKWNHVFELKEELLKEYEAHKELVLQGKAEFYKL